MAKLVVQVGPITAVIKDDRAILDESTLGRWAKEVSAVLSQALPYVNAAEVEEGDDG